MTRLLLSLPLVLLLCGGCTTSEVKPAPATRVTYEDTSGDLTATRFAVLGMQVEKLATAMRDPSEPGAMDAVLALGLDTRYYPMVRGWLAYELVATESIIEANKPVKYQHLELRKEFLQEAIRRIDLE